MRHLFIYIKLFSLLAVIAFLLNSCEKDEAIPEDNPPPPPEPAVNLISNPSFEDASGQPNLQGWWESGQWNMAYDPNFIPADTALSGSVDGIHYSNDIPNGGGIWSIQLTSAHWEGRNILAFITGQSGTNIYNLTLQAKRTPWNILATVPTGTAIGIDKWSSSSAFSFVYLDTIQQWKQYVYCDTITTLPTDTIVIYIHSYAGQMAKTDYLFDKIEVYKTGL